MKTPKWFTLKIQWKWSCSLNYQDFINIMITQILWYLCECYDHADTDELNTKSVFSHMLKSAIVRTWSKKKKKKSWCKKPEYNWQALHLLLATPSSTGNSKSSQVKYVQHQGSPNEFLALRSVKFSFFKLLPNVFLEREHYVTKHSLASSSLWESQHPLGKPTVVLQKFLLPVFACPDCFSCTHPMLSPIHPAADAPKKGKKGLFIHLF